MKNLIFILLLLSTSSFADTRVQLPECFQGQAYYQSQEHVATDFCVNGLGALSPADCRIKIEKLRSKGTLQSTADTFFEKRTKEVCGK